MIRKTRALKWILFFVLAVIAWLWEITKNITRIINFKDNRFFNPVRREFSRGFQLIARLYCSILLMSIIRFYDCRNPIFLNLILLKKLEIFKQSGKIYPATYYFMGKNNFRRKAPVFRCSSKKLLNSLNIKEDNSFLNVIYLITMSYN